MKIISTIIVIFAAFISLHPLALSAQAEEKEQINVTKDGTKYIVHPDKIMSGGPPRDGIPSIDKPLFVTVKEAEKWIKDSERVLFITHEGVKRAYPIQVMVWHEIVNDTIASTPIVITYCPLCGSGIAYERKINGVPVEFGTSGRLYNSNLVMYDRKSESLWTQIEGKAIVGEMSGYMLEPLSIDTLFWRDIKERHPDAQVLSKDAGHRRDYGRDPYGDYYEKRRLYFSVENEDDSLHPKAVIFGIKVNGTYKAYSEHDLLKRKEFNDTVGGVKVRVERFDDGVVKFTNLDTKDEIVKERDFWFAWYAFHPETQLYTDPKKK